MRAKGPSVKAAFDAEGMPTKAAEGFARSKGVAVEDLVRAEEAGGEYVYAVIERDGATAHLVVRIETELMKWLSSHIKRTDTQLAPCVKGKA